MIQSELPEAADEFDAHSDERDRNSWLALLQVSVATYLMCLGSGVLYALLTMERAYRPIFLIVTIGGMLFALEVHRQRQRIITNDRPVPFFASWNVATFILIFVLCRLDGGLGSPVTYFMALPMIYLAIGFPLRIVAGCGVFGLLGYACLVALSPDYRFSFVILFQSTTLLASFAFAVVSALTRLRLDALLFAFQQRLRDAARFDVLTGCLNKHAFDSELARESARAARYGETLALLAIDIDNFKTVNDTHGHPIGDQVLQRVGTVLNDNARQADRIGRTGGDEFALLAPRTNAEQARALAERIRKSPSLTADSEIDLALSVGVCDAPNGELGIATLYRRADETLYRAKRAGRNQVAVWRPDDAAPSE